MVIIVRFTSVVEPGSLAELSLGQIEAACRQQTELYRRTGSSDARFCLEIFRRALAHGSHAGPAGAPAYASDDARDVLVRLYSEFIKAQVNRKALVSGALDDLLQQVWMRFWQAANAGLSFVSLEAALSYLKQTTLSVIIEEQRRFRKRSRDESLAQLIEAPGSAEPADERADVFNLYVQRRFRERCNLLLRDPLEHRIFWMRYGLGLAPREIARALAAEGLQLREVAPTARAVSDLLERCFRYLSQDREIQDLLQSD